SAVRSKTSCCTVDLSIGEWISGDCTLGPDQSSSPRRPEFGGAYPTMKYRSCSVLWLRLKATAKFGGGDALSLAKGPGKAAVIGKACGIADLAHGFLAVEQQELGIVDAGLVHQVFKGMPFFI